MGPLIWIILWHIQDNICLFSIAIIAIFHFKNIFFGKRYQLEKKNQDKGWFSWHINIHGSFNMNYFMTYPGQYLFVFNSDYCYFPFQEHFLWKAISTWKKKIKIKVGFLDTSTFMGPLIWIILWHIQDNICLFSIAIIAIFHFKNIFFGKRYQLEKKNQDKGWFSWHINIHGSFNMNYFMTYPGQYLFVFNSDYCYFPFQEHFLWKAISTWKKNHDKGWFSWHINIHGSFNMNYFMTYPGQYFGESYALAEMQSVHSTTPADWATEHSLR